MIHVRICYTLRRAQPGCEWQQVHEDHKSYPDMAAARAAVKDQYAFVKKRRPVYQDTQSRGVVQCGHIYCYKERQWERDRSFLYYYQDWVTFYEADYRVVDVRRKERAHEPAD